MFKRCGMSTEKQANGLRPREVTRFYMDSRRYTVGLNQGGTPLTKDTTKVCTPVLVNHTARRRAHVHARKGDLITRRRPGEYWTVRAQQQRCRGEGGRGS